MIKIIVDTEEEKEEILKLSEILHDARFLGRYRHKDMFNTFSHLYLNPDLVEVKK